MTHDVIDRLVRPANPVPDPKMLEAVEASTLEMQRREEMQGQQVDVGGHVDETRSRGPLVGIAAAVVVLVIGGLALIQLTDDSDVAAGTPTEIATEYVEAYTHHNLKLTSGIYGSTFFPLTAFHGFHVTVGALMLLVVWFRCLKGHFTPTHHFAFEGVAWYWHFVDVVWLGLFIFVYWL